MTAANELEFKKIAYEKKVQFLVKQFQKVRQNIEQVTPSFDYL